MFKELMNSNIYLSILFLTVFLIIIYLYEKKKDDVIYYRGVPDDLSMPIIQYYNKGRFNRKTIWLMLLDLVRRDYYTLKKIEGKYTLKWNKENLYNYNTTGLKTYEVELINFINSFLNNKDGIELKQLMNSMKVDPSLKNRTEKIFKSIMYEIEYKYGKVEVYKNYLIIALMIIIYSTLAFGGVNTIFYIVYFLLFSMAISVIKNLKFNFFGIAELLLTLMLIIPGFLVMATFSNYNLPTSLILLYNPVLYYIGLRILSLKFYTKDQQEIAAKIRGMKLLLKEVTLLKERPLDYINFLEQYYVLAEALDVKITDTDHVEAMYDDDTIVTFDSFEMGMILVHPVVLMLYEKIKRDSPPY